MTTKKSKANLTNQVYLPSITTSFFFNEKEQQLQQHIFDMYSFIEMNKVLIKENKKQYKHLRKTNKNIQIRIDKANRVMNRIIKYNKEQRYLTGEIKPNHIVGMFESALSRIAGLSVGSKEDKTDDMIIVEVFHNEMFKHLLFNGFIYNGNEYKYFSSSSGQIKTRKGVFAKKSLLDKHMLTLMCGLTIEDINKKGGINPNKLLSYLMLNNSATTKFDVDLNKIVVIDDMETVVHADVDFVDDISFKINRIKNHPIDVNQTDGVGFCLSEINDKAFMIRGPWMKGLVVPVPFDKFEGKTTKIVDVWGREWDIIEDGIKIILHKSQLKLAAYYDSWTDYKTKFKDNKCHLSIGNIEDEQFKTATLTYQMLQTLVGIKGEEIDEIVKTTNEKISLIGRDKDIMFDILGVTKSNKYKNYLQQSIELYPNLISDNYTKEIIKDLKKSLVNDGKSGKLEIPNAKYTYVVPDVYAWMDWLFNKNENPKGLLQGEQVSCKMYDNGKINVLRNPHLYREWGIADNVVNDETSKWFISNSVYVSIESCLSKLLAFDCDGDKLLLSDNKTLLSASERDMANIVPLIFNLRSADKQIINNQVIYDSLMAGFNSRIGEISNAISRAWHMDNINDQVMDDLKIMCAMNNQEIDFSKTLFRSNIPDDIKERLNKYQRGKLPLVFHYAKNKKMKYVKNNDNSTMDKIIKKVINTRINFEKLFGDCDYQMFMSNKPNIRKGVINDRIIETYIKLNKSKHLMMKNEHKISNNSRREVEHYVFKYIRNELLKIASKQRVTDVLIHYLYKIKDATNKDTLWNCFGETMFNNLRANLDKIKPCESCGVNIERKQGKKYCDICAKMKEAKRKKDARKKIS